MKNPLVRFWDWMFDAGEDLMERHLARRERLRPLYPDPTLALSSAVLKGAGLTATVTRGKPPITWDLSQFALLELFERDATGDWKLRPGCTPGMRAHSVHPQLPVMLHVWKRRESIERYYEASGGEGAEK